MVSTHMPLARHDFILCWIVVLEVRVSTHMPLARHDVFMGHSDYNVTVSTHMPLARHDLLCCVWSVQTCGFYSHASCEA